MVGIMNTWSPILVRARLDISRTSTRANTIVEAQFNKSKSVRTEGPIFLSCCPHCLTQAICPHC